MSTEDHLKDEFSTVYESTDGIEQMLVKFQDFVEQPINGEDSSAARKDLWIRFLGLWDKMLHLAVKATESDATLFEKCTNTFSTILVKVDIDELIKTDGSVAHKTFFGCLDLLNIPTMRQYLSDGRQTHQSFSDIYFVNVQYLLMLGSITCTYVPFHNILPDNYIELLDVLKVNVEKNIPNGSSGMKHELGAIASRILSLFWNMADRTILVPSLLRVGLAASAIQWLANSTSLTTTARRPLISIVHNIARHDDGSDELNKHNAIEIVKAYQNTQDVKKDIKVSLLSSITLAELSTPEQLKKDKKGMNGVLNQLLQLTMDAANSKTYRAKIVSFHVSEPLAVLAKLFVVDERTLDYILMHAETEPPSDMASTIKLFADILINFSNSIVGKDSLDQFTCIAIFNIIWSISFQPQYQEELKENIELMNTIKNLADDDGSHVIDQYKPRAMQSVKKAADGILFNLSTQIPSIAVKILEADSKAAVDIHSVDPTTSIMGRRRRSISVLHTDSKKIHDNKNESNVSSDLPLIMFSYAHADNEFCRHILNHIDQKKNEFKVWIDFQQCVTGDPWEQIADAIERADVIVCFISEFYKQSNSCRQEFTYAADDLHKPIVPILMENYKPRGWLGIRKAGMNYIRFRDVKQPKQVDITNLMDRIRAEHLNRMNYSPSNLESIATLVTPTVPLHHEVSSEPSPIHKKSSNQDEPQSKVDLPPIDQWTPADIDLWFAYHHILAQLRDLYQFQSGSELLDYAQDLVNDRMSHKQLYSRLFAKKYGGDELPPHEFNRFSRALDQLLKENTVEHALSKQVKIIPTKVSQTNSGTCVIL